VEPVRIAVVGAGAFGRNHLRVYRELETAHPELVRLAALVDQSDATRKEAAARYGIPAFGSIAELFAAGLPLDAASICVPTIHHAAVAEQLLNAGLDVLIEKPFAASLAEADRVLALAGRLDRIVQIGHLERFNPAVTAVAERLNNPMFFEAHRLSIFTPRSLDVDVVLDLMIHDLDVVLSLTNSPVREVRAVGLAVLSRKVDIANVRVEFESGCVANFTASRVSTEQVRKVRLFQPHQYLSLDFARQELLSIDVDPAAAAAFLSRSSPPPPAAAGTPGAALQHPSAGLNLQKFDLPRAEPLRLELEDFLRAIRTRTAPRVTGEAGRAALSLALEINREIREHAQRAGLEQETANRKQQTA
jgi:predicted dehydrogenase